MLSDRIILVTGAARGLGREISIAAGMAGATVIVADIDEAGAEETTRMLQGNGSSARAQAVDLANPDSIAACLQSVAQHEKKLHGLVNNGAIATGIGGKRFDEIDIDTWDRVMAVNVRAQWLMIRAAVPLLSAGGEGRIVNLASDTALWGAPNLLGYVASKGAIIAMTRSLARELGPMHIGITSVAPGILTTESTEYVPEARHQHYQDNRAVPGAQSPQDVTGTVNFLLTDDALALTGQTLPVNRGFVFT
ncbi:MAG: SDR family oxidoreductase [Gammaproteobacteria bacterium]|nr:SDR family oxidoreductase [Gammaproteobacteria bacterium]